MTRTDAEQKLDAVHLKMNGVIDNDSDKPKDQATKQDPGADDSVPEESTVKVSFSAGPKSGSVPDVKGLSQKLAKEKLIAEGFTVSEDVRTENSKDVPTDDVTRTDPKAGSVRDNGTEITLYVSNGLVTVPDLTNKTKEEAVAALDKLGLGSDTEEQETPDESKVGLVLEQAPAAGSVKQGTRIKLTIGKAEDNSVTIPSNIIGMSQEDAENALGALSLNVDPPTLVPDDTVPAGTVMDSNPKQGAQVKVGDTVVLTVSSGPATPGGGQPTTPGVGQGTGPGNGNGDGSTQG
jgi:serine/threonine-protein kinase